MRALLMQVWSCASQMNLKQELEGVLDGNTKKLSDMEAELSLFTAKIERRQTEVDSMTKRIIATSGGNVEKVCQRECRFERDCRKRIWHKR
jgi:hypothetical protein